MEHLFDGTLGTGSEKDACASGHLTDRRERLEAHETIGSIPSEKILMAWVFTLPVAMLLAGGLFRLFLLFV